MQVLRGDSQERAGAGVEGSVDRMGLFDVMSMVDGRWSYGPVRSTHVEADVGQSKTTVRTEGSGFGFLSVGLKNETTDQCRIKRRSGAPLILRFPFQNRNSRTIREPFTALHWLWLFLLLVSFLAHSSLFLCRDLFSSPDLPSPIHRIIVAFPTIASFPPPPLGCERQVMKSGHASLHHPPP